MKDVIVNRESHLLSSAMTNLVHQMWHEDDNSRLLPQDERWWTLESVIILPLFTLIWPTLVKNENGVAYRYPFGLKIFRRVAPKTRRIDF